VLWERCGAKGCTFGWAMQAQDYEAAVLYSPVLNTAQNPYSDKKDLYKWFWEEFPEGKIAEAFHDLYQTWGIGWALDDLGISPYTTDYEGGKNVLYNAGHETWKEGDRSPDEQWYEVYEGGMKKWYRTTGASYSFTVNPEDGIIIGLNRESTIYAAKERNPPVTNELLPKLNQFSDVAWIIWKYHAGQLGIAVNNLKYCK
jgi:hypothetical protein